MQNVCRLTIDGNDVTFGVAPDPYAIDCAVAPGVMSDDGGDPEVYQSVNHELDWLRDVYRTVDPRFNQVTRERLERVLVGLDVAHLCFVRDLNSVILRDQLEIIGGCPEAYEQISLYTDYIFVDNFLTQLMNEDGTNAVTVKPEMSPSRRPLPAHAELDCGFTWEQGRHNTEDANGIHSKRRCKHFISRLWSRSSIRRPLKILLSIFALAFVEQGLERFAPDPLGEWTRHTRKETVSWLVESFSQDNSTRLFGSS